MTDTATAPKVLTGRHVLGIFVGCFSVIIAVNLTLAYQAVATFPGLETSNSYVASQHFEADRAAQDALGWDVTPTLADGTLTVQILDSAGQPVQPAQITAILGRPTQVADDLVPAFSWSGTAFTAPADMAYGAWSLRLEMTAADGTAYRRLYPLFVRDAAR